MPLARLPFWPFPTSNRPFTLLPGLVCTVPSMTYSGRIVIDSPPCVKVTPVFSEPHCAPPLPAVKVHVVVVHVAAIPATLIAQPMASAFSVPIIFQLLLEQNRKSSRKNHVRT